MLSLIEKIKALFRKSEDVPISNKEDDFSHQADDEPVEEHWRFSEAVSPSKKSIGEIYTESSYSKSSDKDFRSVISDLGSLGELQLCNELDKLPMEKYILTNLYLSTRSGQTSEIDVCCLTRYGLFVIEYKNYSGRIYGKEKYKHWLYYGNNAAEPLKFYSPILQNLSHIKALHFNFPQLSPEAFISLIVFSNRSVLNCTECTMPIIHRSELLATMAKCCTTPIFTLQEMEEIYQALQCFCKASAAVKMPHKEFVGQFKN